MCGIVGYVGGRTAAPILLNGLRRPEYRGYDSAGVATIHEDTVSDLKTVGKVAILAESLDAKPLEGTIGIPHTRWATHGRPSERNAHLYFDASHRIAVVHNGIIENHVAIRQFLEGQGIAFQSETDSESIAQMIGFFFDQTGDFVASVRQAVRDVRTCGTLFGSPPHPGRGQAGKPASGRGRRGRVHRGFRRWCHRRAHESCGLPGRRLEVSSAWTATWLAPVVFC